VLAGAAILALFAAQVEASSWNVYLKALLRHAIWTEGAGLGTRQAASMFSRCLCWKKWQYPAFIQLDIAWMSGARSPSFKPGGVAPIKAACLTATR
jgi:hypothetical protein